MSFTAQDVVDKVRFLLAEPDPNNSFFSDNDILSSINSQIMILYRDLDIYNDKITITLQPNQTEYTLPSDVEEVHNVWFVKDNIRHRIEYIEFDDYIDRYDVDTKGDIISLYYIRNAIVGNTPVLIIGFYPTPSTTIEVNLTVIRTLNKISQLTQTIPLEYRHFILLVYLVITEMLERDKRYDEANYFYTKYKDRVMFEQSREKNKIPQYVD